MKKPYLLIQSERGKETYISRLKLTSGEARKFKLKIEEFNRKQTQIQASLVLLTTWYLTLEEKSFEMEFISILGL